jgi:RNA polymerase sigma factor (TIGR02999 family)
MRTAARKWTDMLKLLAIEGTRQASSYRRDKSVSFCSRLTRGVEERTIPPTEAELAGSPHDVTALLHAWGDGDIAARDRLVPVIYQELRRRAAAHLRGERRDHTLQPTALVNEAYLRLVDQHAAWQNREQFFGVASQIMRRILVDRARSRRMNKRSGQWTRVTLDDAQALAAPLDVDVLDLDAALMELATFDPRKSQIAELRFFTGLSLQETGNALGISLATVERDWQAARAWLFKTLTRQVSHEG